MDLFSLGHIDPSASLFQSMRLHFVSFPLYFKELTFMYGTE